MPDTGRPDAGAAPAGFTWPECTDASDQDGQHYVFECETVQGLEVE